MRSNGTLEKYMRKEERHGFDDEHDEEHDDANDDDDDDDDDDDEHDPSISSRLMTTHPLHFQSGLTARLNRI